MRIEITHTVKGTNYAPFIQAFKEALAVDRESNENFKEPRVLVNVFGELNRVRFEYELEQTDSQFQGWLNNGCPSFIEARIQLVSAISVYVERNPVSLDKISWGV